MPVATGAAIAAPDRPVLNLEADGSALYTIQAMRPRSGPHRLPTAVGLSNVGL